MRDTTRNFLVLWGIVVLLIATGFFPSPARSWAQEQPTAETEQVDMDLAGDAASANESSEASTEQPFVRLVKVPMPIQGTVDTQVRRSVEQILSNVPASTKRPIIVLELTPPQNGSGESSEFGRSLDLARYLASPKTSQARMVAYIPKTVRGHAVLVALACEEIIMHPDAQLGAAGVAEATIDESVRSGYREIAGRRLTIPVAVALGLLDPEIRVQRLTTATGTRFALEADVAAIQANVNVQKIDTVIPAGEVGLLSGDKLRLEYGFVSHLAEDRKALASVLRVPPADLEIDPLLTGDWRAIRIDLNGPMNAVIVDQALRGLEDALKDQEGANFICLAIDSPGGSLRDSLRLANYISGLDATRVRTVAYVPREARSDAAIIALACDQLAVKPAAVLGGGGASNYSADDIQAGAVTVQAIMTEKDRTWSLPVAMIDPDLSVHRYQLVDSTVSDYYCQEELEQQRDPDRWQRQEEISERGELLQLTGERAGEIRLARQVVGDYVEFQQAFQLSEPPKVLKPNWAQDLIVALANPRVAAGLLMIGFFAILIEAHTPGLGVGGFVASVCFLLFFWSNFLQGTAGWLEVLLFLAGIVFIGMEIFVIPGFGIFGLGGGVLVVVSLVLASQTFVIPRNEYQLEQLPRSLLVVAAAMAGVGIGAVALNRYLGDSPLIRRFMLMPAEGDAAEELRKRESVVQYDHLLGKQGRTTTQLTPSGKADFDGDLYDVVSEGLVVEKSSRVEAVQVIGNKIVVRKI